MSEMSWPQKNRRKLRCRKAAPPAATARHSLRSRDGGRGVWDSGEESMRLMVGALSGGPPPSLILPLWRSEDNAVYRPIIRRSYMDDKYHTCPIFLSKSRISVRIPGGYRTNIL